MIHYSKGIQTKQNILDVSRRLFYERGYDKVTLREIAAASDTNLGLLNYYFQGKGDLGITIYFEVRKKLDIALKQFFPNRVGADDFLLSSAAELKMCLRSRQYGSFYLLMSKEPQFKKDINETIISTMVKYTKQDYRITDRAILASISTMATKPALVEHFYAYPDQMDENMYLQYYLEMQLHQLNLGTEQYANLFTVIQSFSCSMLADFTPVIEPSHAPVP
ncbi:MAG TPA: helix-turn-helix domain-containing protein [Candidatus Limiplasma sp.]|nr:helix-turn-helix domain-containing protein [Candidatus Limiplasma sp.]HPS80440.1 helix-turn-helix domain-containing protein [Candidatus Limiplasma sp.]